jgi:hypothetical protein
MGLHGLKGLGSQPVSADAGQEYGRIFQPLRRNREIQGRSAKMFMSVNLIP